MASDRTAPHALADLTWPEAADRLRDPATVVVLPIASTEQHGHHLPLGTDAMLAQAVLDAARRRLADLDWPT